MVNSVSEPLIVIEPQAFGPIRTETGELLEIAEGEEHGRQIYPGRFYPQWDEFLVHNSAALPIEVFVGLPGEDMSIQDPTSVIVEPGETVLFNEQPTGDLRIAARYVGASDPYTSDIVSFRSDDTAQSRLFLFREAEGGETVRVMTQRKPKLTIRRRDVLLPGPVLETYTP